jgi:hypothetical protein
MDRFKRLKDTLLGPSKRTAGPCQGPSTRLIEVAKSLIEPLLGESGLESWVICQQK